MATLQQQGGKAHMRFIGEKGGEEDLFCKKTVSMYAFMLPRHTYPSSSTFMHQDIIK